jgi:hypothetical protein
MLLDWPLERRAQISKARFEKLAMLFGYEQGETVSADFLIAFAMERFDLAGLAGEVGMQLSRKRAEHRLTLAWWLLQLSDAKLELASPVLKVVSSLQCVPKFELEHEYLLLGGKIGQLLGC